MPVPVSMQGTVAFSTQARISPAPPRGMSRSTSPFARISSFALSWLVSSRMLRMSASPPAAVMPSLSAAVMAFALRMASRPLRRTQTLPLLMASAAASEVTFGRLS